MSFLLYMYGGALRVSLDGTTMHEIPVDRAALGAHNGIERARLLVLKAVPELDDFDTKIELHRALREIAGGAEMAGPLAEAARSGMVANPDLLGDTNATGGGENRNCVTVTTRYPVEILPRTLREFAEGYAKAMGVPVETLAMLSLAVCASAIGNTFRVRINESWTEACILWAVILMDSGDLKTPIFKAVMKALNSRQAKAEKLYQQQLMDYEEAEAKYQAEMAAWKRDKGGAEAPKKPKAPTPVDYFTSDSTVEAMAILQQANPRGVPLCRDEFSVWLASFGQYKSGRGGDEGAWLEMYTQGTLKITRVLKRIFVQMANASIIGTCQPSVYARLVQGGRDGEGAQIENGMLARFMAFQPAMGIKVWRDGKLPTHLGDKYGELVDGLFAIPLATDEDGQHIPRDIPLSEEAQARFAMFVNMHGIEKSQIANPALRYHYSKLEGIAARLALVIYLCRGVDGEAKDFDCVDLESIEAGIALVGWLKIQAHKLYSRFAESPTEKTHRELVELVQRNGGSISARELARASNKHRESGTAEASLEDLVTAGIGVWVYQEQTGRGHPVKRFSLSRDSDTNTAGTIENANCVTGGVL